MSKAPMFTSDAFYRQLCEHLGVAVIATDPELTISAWNAAAARMFGAGADRMIGTDFMSIIPQERRAEAERLMRRVLASGEIFHFEFQHRDEQGRRRELIGTMAPILGESGTGIGASVCIRDITRRIELQDEVNQNRKMAALGELAGAIAHHFNNILGGVITSVDFTRGSHDAALAERVLDQTADALQRAAKLLHGLQAFAEGDQRADDLADFTEVLNGIADELEPMLERRQIAFDLSLPRLPVLPVPRVQVQTIMRNITLNAVEAMPEGGRLSIDVSLDNRWIVARIADTGIGLDEEALTRVFEPFWSTKKRLTSKTGEGAGLGLAIAHGLAQVIGGSISVTSSLGKGSCFRVAIPRPDPL